MSASVHPIVANLSTPRFSALPPLTLYIHIPWCIRKCPYCDFNSHEQRQALPEARYVEALMSDLETALPSIWGRKFAAIFFGGGTPSLFSPASIDAIVAGVRARMPVPPGIEISLRPQISGSADSRSAIKAST